MFVQYSTPDESIIIDATKFIGFFGNTFGASIDIGSAQSKTFQTNSIATYNGGELPNVKYISSTQCDIGSGTISLTQVPFSKCTLRLRLASGSLSAVHLPIVKLIAHSGSNVAVGPLGATIYGFEKGNSSWTVMSGSAAPLTLTPHTVSGSYVHDYYVGLSAVPSVITRNSAISLSLYVKWY